MICPCCKQETDDVERRRMNTRYVKDELNYLVSCLSCWELSEQHWADMWSDYYSDVL